MSTLNGIVKQKRLIVRTEKALALEKLKKLRADARRKIELGGLVIKAGLGDMDKAMLLGALDYILQLIADEAHQHLFEIKGKHLFLES